MSSAGEQQVVDRFGHSGYAVVILAPADVQREIELVRRQLEIPIHMIPAHVTVKGTFINPPSVEEVGTIVEGVARWAGRGLAAQGGLAPYRGVPFAVGPAPGPGSS